MTQPERPHRAAAEQLRHDRVAAQLQNAAHSYEPDGERIRMLVDARITAVGGAPIKAGEARGLGGRTVMWPVVGSAAAAAVILAVAASGATETPGLDPAQGTVVVDNPANAVPSSQPGQIASATSTSVSQKGSAPVAPPSVAGGSDAHGTVTTGPAGPRGGSGGGKGSAADPDGRAAPSRALAAASTTSGMVSGRSVTAAVRPVSGAQQVSLGAAPGQTWALAGPSLAASTASLANATSIGPIQVLANGATSEPGPFTIRWQNGTPQSSGTSSSWLVVPAVSSSPSQTLANVPVRFKSDAFTVVLYVGTVGGGGRLQVGTGNGSLRVSLPSCGQATTCASVVTITSHGGPGVSPTGDLPVALISEGASKVAIAAASLG
jgi:hypothetical protein